MSKYVKLVEELITGISLNTFNGSFNKNSVK